MKQKVRSIEKDFILVMLNNSDLKAELKNFKKEVRNEFSNIRDTAVTKDELHSRLNKHQVEHSQPVTIPIPV